MDSIILHFNNISANEKARDIFNLVYNDTEENRINFEKELIKLTEEDYLLKSALRAHYIQVFRVGSSIKPMEWARKLLIKYKILNEFDR